MNVREGETWLVFDNVLWGGKDVGDNSQYWKWANVLSVEGETARVRFAHDGRVSRGHFCKDMRLWPR